MVFMDTSYQKILDLITTDAVRVAAKSYLINVDRVYSLLKLPVVLSHMVATLARAVIPALNATGVQSLSVDPAELQRSLQEMVSEFSKLQATGQLTSELAVELINAKLAALETEKSGLFQLIQFVMIAAGNLSHSWSLTQEASGNWRLGVTMTDSQTESWSRLLTIALTAIDTPVRPGFDAVLSASIVGTWTAIEALAGDLWEAALNTEPEILAKLSGAKQTKEGDKKIDLNYIHKYGYKLTQVMGTILRDRFRFITLEGIKEAYDAAFSEDEDAPILVEMRGGSPV
jgi:hypothetical protein